MQEEILELYEKIKDQISQEQFQAEMAKVRESFGLDFIDDVDCAREVLKNYGIETNEVISQKEESSEEVPFEISLGEENQEESSEEQEEFSGFTMDEDILEKYEKVKDKISEEDFLNRMAEFKKVSDNPFMNASGFADMVVGEFITEKPESLSEKPEHSDKTISDLEKGANGQIISGRVISISNPRKI